jgi:nucleoid-associated protein YgaU
MKHNEVPEISHKIKPQNYENIFNVYFDSDNEWYFYNILRKVNFPDNLDTGVYSVYRVMHGETWPGLAWKFYKNVKLWWVICAVNKVYDPTDDPTGGTELKILTANTVRSILNEIQSQ